MDKIFNEIAKRNMINWNLHEFIKTHPRLYKTIIESMQTVADSKVLTLKDLPNGY